MQANPDTDATPCLCRACGMRGRGWRGACPSCRSGRVISHARLFDLRIAHVDCDAFYAAIEKRDNPQLAPEPVIVGGGKRGVVLTCCYLARTFGVRSAMPMFKALRACPSACVVKPRMDVYASEGRKIREMMSALTPLVEPVSIDEAFLDLAGTDRLHGAPPAATLALFQARVERELGLTVSIGLSSNKFLAKIASDHDKPRGFFVMSQEEAVQFLSPMRVEILPGVGRAMAERLGRDGCRTVSDIQRIGDAGLVKRYGDTGRWLWACAHGGHDRPVNPHGDRKSVSSETTLETDLSTLEKLEDVLWRVCQRTADRAKAAGVEGRVVTLKLKTSDFRSFTRRCSIPEGTQLAQVLFRTSRPMLAREIDGRAYRLVGVGISDLAPAARDATDLADPKAAKRAGAERAADKARLRFGSDAVTTGRGARARTQSRPPPQR